MIGFKSVAAVVVAGGKGARFGARMPKQYLPLKGVPVLIRSLLLLKKTGLIDNLYAGVPHEDFDRVRALLKQWALDRDVMLTPGGESRQETVFLALQAVSRSDYILIHDAARPLAGEELIRKGLKALEENAAVVPALPLTDTVKEIRGDFVVRTLERDALRAVQTPQFFHFTDLKKLHDQFRGKDAGDDSLLFELKKKPVLTILGEETNIKLTTPDDFVRAEEILEKRRV